ELRVVPLSSSKLCERSWWSSRLSRKQPCTDEHCRIVPTSLKAAVDLLHDITCASMQQLLVSVTVQHQPHHCMKTTSSIIHRIGLTLALTLGAWTTGLHAQPGSLDTNFNAVATSLPNPPSPFGTHIGFSVAVQPDGKVIAVGTFGVMRFLSDGAVDPAFHA